MRDRQIPGLGGPRGGRPRVLLVVHQLSRTGAPILALRVFQALGHDVALRTVALDGGPLEPDFARLGELRVLATCPRLLQRHLSVRERSLLAKASGFARAPMEGWLARRWRPDVVYANSVWSLPIVERLGRGRQQVLLHVHESSVALEIFEAAHPGLIRSLPSSYVAVSERVRRDLQARYDIPAASIRVIPPFVDVPPAGPPKDEPEGARLVVGGIGYPSWTKACDLWLLTARELADRLGQTSVGFKWVGVPDNQDGIQFRAMVDKLHLGLVVDLVATTTEPLNHLRTFDVLAMTSWEESASLVVLDAMTIGVPVVCFRGVGGPEEELLDTGVVVESFSPSAMARALEGLMGDPLRRAELASAAHDRVTSVYSRTKVVPMMLEEIERLARLGRAR